MGVDRKAQPIDLMKACLQSFQARNYARLKKQELGEEDADDVSSAMEDPENRGAAPRRALGSLKGTGAVRAYASENTGISGLGSKRANPAPVSNNGAGGLSIFVDDEFNSSNTDTKRRRLNSSGASASSGGKPGWSSMPTEAEKHKENQAQPSRWTGVQLQQDSLAKAGSVRAAAGTSKPKSDFAVFEDTGVARMAQQQRAAPAGGAGTALKLRMVDGADGGSAASRRIADIQSNPMKPLPYRFKVSTETYEKGENKPRINSEGQMEISAYDRAAVYPGDGKEYSFEEIRAHRRGYSEPWREPAPEPVSHFNPPAAVITSNVPDVPSNPFAGRESITESAPAAAALADLDELSAPLSSSFVQRAVAPVDKENGQPTAAPLKKAKAPFRERTVILASSSSTAAPPVTAAAPVRQSFVEDEPEPTTTGLMTVHTRAALANFIDIFNAPSDRSLDASNDAEMTSGIVTSLIQVKPASSGFAIFEDNVKAASSTSQSAAGGFVMFDDFTSQEPELDQENRVPGASKESPSIPRRSGIALAPIEDGSVPVDPAAISGPFFEDEQATEEAPLQQSLPVQSVRQNTGAFTVFEEAPVLNASLSIPFESLIDTSPLARGPKGAKPNASFAVTPFDTTTKRPLEVDAELMEAPRVLDFENDDLMFSPRTDMNTIANRGIVNSPLSPLSSTRQVGGASKFSLLDNTGQFTVSGLNLTGNFDVDTRSLLDGQSLTSMISGVDTRRESAGAEQTSSSSSMRTVSFKNSMNTVKINAPAKSSTVDPYSAMASQLSSMMKDLNLGSSTSFADLSTQFCPELSTRAGSSISLGSKSAIVLREIPCPGPVGTKLLEVELSAKSFLLRVNPKASAWEFYIARRLSQKLAADKQRLVVSPSSFFLFRDASVVLYPMSYSACLQDLIPATQASIMDESLAAYCACHLLEISKQIHAQGVIIGNLSAKNIFLLNGSLLAASNFKPSGSEWAFRTPSITDLSRAIDVRSFGDGARFSPAAMTLPPQLQELVSSRDSCSYEIDALAICEIIHSLLFAKPISVEFSQGKWIVTSAFKSYWKAPWAHFFESLLNVSSNDLPNVTSGLIEQLEKYFSANPGKLRSLQVTLSALK